MIQTLKAVGRSRWFDWVGVVIVILTSIGTGYLFSTLHSIDKFANPIVLSWSWAYLIPFGILSTLNSAISLLSTRLIAKLNRWGNVIGSLNALLSGMIDFTMGNKAAIYTFPLTFLLNVLSIIAWHRYGRRVNSSKNRGGIIALISLTAIGLSFGIHYWAFGGLPFLAILTAIIFASATIANALDVMKITTQWHFWFGYNVLQTAKSVLQGNFANLGKYLYYILNSIIAILVWHDEETKKHAQK